MGCKSEARSVVADQIVVQSLFWNNGGLGQKISLPLLEGGEASGVESLTVVVIGGGDYHPQSWAADDGGQGLLSLVNGGAFEVSLERIGLVAAEAALWWSAAVQMHAWRSGTLW